MTQSDTPADAAHSARPAPAPTLPTDSGRSRLSRAVRRIAGKPGTPGFRAAKAVRRFGTRVSARSAPVRGRLRRMPAQPRPGHAVVRAAGYPVQARVVPDATPLAEHHRLVAALGAVLAARGVDYFVVPGPAGELVVGVPSKRRNELHAALTALAASEDILVSPVQGSEPLVFRPCPTRPFPAGIRQLVLWSPVVAADGASLLGADSRVTLQVWESDRKGVLRAPADNRYAPSLPRGAQGEKVPVLVGESPQPTFPEMAETHIDDITFPVDLVYTWVDGTDPVWRARMVAARERHHLPVHRASTDESRFLSVDELKYSFRSAFAFLPWFRRIFLVTDRQVPDWLETEDRRITVVSHDDIWSDRSQLPVFNSHAIEARLHHIPGLSEHYVYLNDDVFFGRMIPASTFFTPGGLCRFFPSPTRIGLGGPVLGEPPGSTAAKNDREVLRQAVGAIQTRRLRHTAHAQRRSVAQALEQEFPDVYAATAGSTFRSPHDISPIALQTWYAYRTGRAFPGFERYAYVGLSSRAEFRKLDYIRGGQVTMFCLNQEEDVEDDAMDRIEMIRVIKEFLDEYFPFQSPLERRR